MNIRPGRGFKLPFTVVCIIAGSHTGCDLEDPGQQQRIVDQERQWRETAERATPDQDQLKLLRETAQAFMTEHHSDLNVQGFSFTQLTPNVYLIGAEVISKTGGNKYIAQLTAERFRDVEDDGEGSFQEADGYVWLIDWAGEEKMDAIAQRHGFYNEVQAIKQQHTSSDEWSYGHHHWHDNYIMWGYVYNRPAPIIYSYGGSSPNQFTPAPRGYRFSDPVRPIVASDAVKATSIATKAGGRSTVFTQGRPWAPPAISHYNNSLHGKPFFVSGNGKTITASASKGSLSSGKSGLSMSRGSGSSVGKASAGGRGGFGGGGRAAGTGG